MYQFQIFFSMEMIMFKISYIIGLSLIGTIVQSDDIWLPNNIKPILYKINKTIHLENEFKFEGTVNIKVSRKGIILPLSNHAIIFPCILVYVVHVLKRHRQDYLTFGQFRYRY